MLDHNDRNQPPNYRRREDKMCPEVIEEESMSSNQHNCNDHEQPDTSAWKPMFPHSQHETPARANCRSYIPTTPRKILSSRPDSGIPSLRSRNSGIGQGGKTAFIFPKCGLVPTPVDYWICTTFQRERYRRYFMAQHRERPLFESYRELALQFPRGLAESAELPEEASGAVQSAWTQTRRAA